jgi:hypothetical protein
LALRVDWGRCAGGGLNVCPLGTSIRADYSVDIREHKDLALGWESGIGTTGQYLPQDLIPGNMDDGFHHRDDEAVLGVRATRVSGWEAK